MATVTVKFVSKGVQKVLYIAKFVGNGFHTCLGKGNEVAFREWLRHGALVRR